MTADNLSNRRGFLATAGAATVGALLARPRAIEAKPSASGRQAEQKRRENRPNRGRCDRALDGGRHGTHGDIRSQAVHALQKGLESNAVLSTFRSIPTAIDGVRISQGLEKIAAVLDRGTLIRTHVAADLGKILHSRHQYHWHTGYEPPQTVAPRTSGPGSPTRRGPRIRLSPPSSTSASVMTATARLKSSRPFRPAVASVPSTARFASPTPNRPCSRSARRQA